TGGRMPHEEDGGRQEPLAELRATQADGLARRRLSKTQLAGLSGLGRTTVQAVFRTDSPAPSAETVAALADVLGLPHVELLELRRRAAGAADPRPERGGGPGRPIGEWDPHDLEVHPAGTAGGFGARSGRALSGYVRRAHDQVLASAVREAKAGRSGMVVLVGSSSTGKTRACWEAVQPLAADGWQLWHPYDPARAEAALADLGRVAPRTVVWLNEAQHYLGDQRAGERIAAALHTLLTGPHRGPVLILGTLWPEYSERYTALPVPGAPDPHSRVRELLTGRTLTVPDTFGQNALDAAAALALGGDQLLADALTRARTHGRLAQDLAGAPELLRRYEHGSPAARALLEAAMDARRLGVGLHLPHAFLTEAAADYLSDHDYDQLTEDWAEAAFGDLARPVHGKQAPLRPASVRPGRRAPDTSVPATHSGPPGPMFRLADYLEQHGRTSRNRLCPPASFWQAAHTHLARPDDLDNLAAAAEARHRLQWAHHLRHRAADAGHPSALTVLGSVQEKAGDREGAEALAHRAAVIGDAGGLFDLAQMREAAGDREGAEALARRAADAGQPLALASLAQMREAAGDREGAEALARRAAAAGQPDAMAILALIREAAGEAESAETLFRQAADAGDAGAMSDLARLREKAGDREGAEAVAHRAAAAGHNYALAQLAQIREKAGNHDGAEALYRQAADAGQRTSLFDKRWPYGLDPDGSPTPAWR
ncbi:helix-turn-helix domain-containing protein, partial [Kitasatospora sp. NPDC058263]